MILSKTKVKRNEVMIKMTVGVEQRRDEITEMVREQGSVRVSQISRIYGVSEVTVRNDLEYLEAQGILSRVHGGAVGTGKHYINMDMSDRYMSNSSSKKELALRIASLIENNDTIMMNAGTTLTYVLHAIRGKRNISIVTNSIQNAVEASTYPDFNVILLGGEIDEKYQFTYGNDTLSQLDKYHATKCILSVDGIHSKDGLTLYYSNESGIVRKMISCSDKVIVAADGSKLGKNTFSRVASAKDMDILVTNKTDSQELELLKKQGVVVYEA